jgi:hypothetical protein
MALLAFQIPRRFLSNAIACVICFAVTLGQPSDDGVANRALRRQT